MADAPAVVSSGRPAEELLQELQIHQIELEMQNEALRQTQIALEESRDRYVDLYEFAPVGYLTLRPDGLISRINLTGAMLLGRERKALLKKRFGSFVVAKDQDRWTRRFMSVRERDGHSTLELTLRRGDGTEFQARLDCVRQTSGTELKTIRVTLTDISESKKAEAELMAVNRQLDQLTRHLTTANAELEQFAYALSHDLREPLRMVAAYIALIKKKIGSPLTDELRTFMDFAIDGAKRMDAMIIAMLEYSRTGHDEEALEPLPLSEVVTDCLGNFSDAVARTGARIIVDKHLPIILGSRMELTRLFQNLIGNSLKYQAEDRPPHIGVGWRDGGADWVIWVKDNGIGIEPESCDRAFHVFKRLGPHQRSEGAGIGLAICKKIIDHHKGRIWIESHPDQGCSVMIALPKSAAAPPA
ncbi:MAG: ATP-binding protein [Phaeospirillum sp.]|nr:ATP-binding protein [Phaeospirillum sp.]